MCIYCPICKLAKTKIGKKILNVTTVKLFLEHKIKCFWGFLMPFCFKLYLKVNIFPFHSFLLVIAKIGNDSKFTKELEIFTNWTVVDGIRIYFMTTVCSTVRPHSTLSLCPRKT